MSLHVKFPKIDLYLNLNFVIFYDFFQMSAYINKMFGYKPPVLFSRHLYFVYFDRYLF